MLYILRNPIVHYLILNQLKTWWPLPPKITRRPSWPWSYGSWIYNYICNQCLSPLMLWVRILIRERCTTLCDKVSPHLVDIIFSTQHVYDPRSFDSKLLSCRTGLPLKLLYVSWRLIDNLDPFFFQYTSPKRRTLWIYIFLFSIQQHQRYRDFLYLDIINVLPFTYPRI
jgi:hypothetical protein